MKKILNSILILITFVALSFTTKAASITTLVNGTNSFYQNQSHITRLTLANVTTTNYTARFVDTPNSSTNWTSGAFTNTLSYTTNLIYTTTNILGIVATYTNRAVITIPNAVAGATQVRKVITMLAVAAGNTVDVTMDSYTSYGLFVTTDGPLTITVTYSDTLP